MMPFWADAGHSCSGCGADDIGLYPNRCRCFKGQATSNTDTSNMDERLLLTIVAILGLFAIYGGYLVVQLFYLLF